MVNFLGGFFLACIIFATVGILYLVAVYAPRWSVLLLMFILVWLMFWGILASED